MNKKILIWTIGILLLTSLAYADQVEDIKNKVNSVFPNLLSGDARLSLEEAETLVKHVREEPKAVLENEGEVQIMSMDAWKNELVNSPPGGHSRKVNTCIKSEGKSREECVNSLLGDYGDKFQLTEEEKAKIASWSDEEKSYLFSTLGRSRGKNSMIVYWMLRHPQFDYIKFHENFHTYTTYQVNMLKQIELLEQKIAEAPEENKAELQKKLEIQKQQALFVILWLMYVGDEKAVFFSTYGQTNLYESLAEFFARFWTGHLSEDLKTASFDQQKRMMAAVALSECFGLDESLDGAYGKGVFEKFFFVVDANNLRGEYDRLKAEIEKEAGGCPPPKPEEMTYSGEGYLCNYKLKENGKDINVENCEYVELANFVTSPRAGFESNYVVKGSTKDVGYISLGKFIVTDEVGDNAEVIGGAGETTFEPYSRGLVVITGNVEVGDVEFYAPDPVTTDLELVGEFNVGELAELSLKKEELPDNEIKEFSDWQERMIEKLGVLNNDLSDLDSSLARLQSMLGYKPSGCTLATAEVSQTVQQNIQENQGEINELVGKILQGEDVTENQNKIRNLVFSNVLSDEQEFLMWENRMIKKLDVLNSDLTDLNNNLEIIEKSLS